MKPFIVVGTRPEIIKMAPVVHELERRKIDYFLLHTGQHYSDNMSDSIFRDVELRLPDVNLDIGPGSHSQQIANALVGIEKELMKQNPELVLVLGDTNAVLSGALAAVKLNIPVGHVEAGLRSYDNRMPEEHNRRVTDHLSKFLFAPTENSAEILRKENVWGEISITGNTVIDILESQIHKVANRKTVAKEMVLENYALLTMHRAENVDERSTLSGLVKGLLSLDMDIIFPAHPRVVARLTEFGLIDDIRKSTKVHIVEPVGYLDFLALMKSCTMILTDSGGIQEEATAPSINKKVFVLRSSTERPEAVESGHSTVVGIDASKFPMKIKSEIEKGFTTSEQSPYGCGDASEKIVNILQEHEG
ncbi:MAG: non-hydrolyzing UDP-N-acetylglucosamine 2-epimerase [Candidatus Thorarchaeota archaeon]